MSNVVAQLASGNSEWWLGSGTYATVITLLEKHKGVCYSIKLPKTAPQFRVLCGARVLLSMVVGSVLSNRLSFIETTWPHSSESLLTIHRYFSHDVSITVDTG